MKIYALQCHYLQHVFSVYQQHKKRQCTLRLKKLLDKILDNFWEKILLQLVKFTNLFQQQQEGKNK